jgi:hypothetical protein
MKNAIILGASLATACFLLPGISRARMYSVNTGRFQTMDSFEGTQENPQTLHKYLYVADDPVNGTDPTGHDFDLDFSFDTFFGSFSLGGLGAQIEMLAEEAVAGDVEVPMTSEKAIARYGAYKDSVVKAGNWPNERRWMTTFNIPDGITSDPDYNWINSGGGGKTKKIYLNRDIEPRLENALDKLKTGHNLNQLKTFDGCFNARSARGATSISAHAYGIALDINASDNQMGTSGSQPQSLVDAFTESGFIWGGSFSRGRQDPMHFSLGF